MAPANFPPTGADDSHKCPGDSLLYPFYMVNQPQRVDEALLDFLDLQEPKNPLSKKNSLSCQPNASPCVERDSNQHYAANY
jgi:hypothetical protein